MSLEEDAIELLELMDNVVDWEGEKNSSYDELLWLALKEKPHLKNLYDKALQ